MLRECPTCGQVKNLSYRAVSCEECYEDYAPTRFYDESAYSFGYGYLDPDGEELEDNDLYYELYERTKERKD